MIVLENLSVSVRIPALKDTYDFTIPSNMLVQDAITLMTRILNSEYGISGAINNVVLIDKGDNTVLSMSDSFAEQGISDGAKFLLV